MNYVRSFYMPATVLQTVTPDIVKAFYQYMHSQYGSCTVDKSNSEMMQVIAGTLGVFGILDAEAFMKSYTTTIGKTIYIPFKIGEASGNYDLWHQIQVCVHEHQHIEISNRDWLYNVKYLVSKAERAVYEAECYRSDLEMWYWHTKQIIDPRGLAEKLLNYGCNPVDVDTVAIFLASSAETVKRGGVINRSSQLAQAWLNSHTPFLKAA